MIRWNHAFIDRPYDRFEQAGAFWTSATGTHLSDRRGARGEFATLLPAAGDACLKLQGVRDSGGAHLDLSVADVPAALGRARELGAAVVAPHEDWAVLSSPGGLPFCLVPWAGETVRPPAVDGPGGTASRLDQICIDLAPAAYDDEVAFWTALTGWRQRRGALSEFTLLKPPEPVPVQILLQRLGDARPTSAHLDLSCSDVDAVRSWHEELGARLMGPGRSWLVMADPAGGTYCLTARDPRAGGRSQ